MPPATLPLDPDLSLLSEKLADLRTISFHQLQAGSVSEQNLLLLACIQDGFFYLDLTDPKFSSLLGDVDVVFKLAKDVFDYSPEIKSLFDVDSISDLKVNGYKPKGRNVVSKSGKSDGFETWVLPRNGLLQLADDPFPHPPIIASYLSSLRGLLKSLTDAAHTIFGSLSSALLMPAGQRFEDFQGLSRPSPDILRLLKYHANSNTDCLPHIPHTDLGSLTFVFSTTPGLQILPANVEQKSDSYCESDWRYVAPRHGHAIVNIGDCVTMMTNGLLKSALHRVGPIAGCAMPERYSLAYLMRPEDQTLLRPLKSPLIPRGTGTSTDEENLTSATWIRKKFGALRGTQDQGNFDQILTGGRGILL